MPNCNPRDIFLGQYLTLMKDSYSLNIYPAFTYVNLYADSSSFHYFDPIVVSRVGRMNIPAHE